MQAANIYLTVTDKDIIIHFEALSFNDDIDKDEHEKRNRVGPILDFMLAQFAGNDRGLLQKKLNRNVEYENKKFRLYYKNNTFYCEANSVGYSLPYERSTALDLLSTIDVFYDTKKFNYVLIGDSSIRENIKKDILSISFEDLTKNSIDTSKQRLSQLIAKKILSFNGSSKLKDTLDAITKIDAFSTQNKIPFSECLDVIKRCLILDPIVSMAYATGGGNNVSMVNLIFNTLQRMSTYNKEEFTHLVENICLNAKKNLFKQCIDKKAPDGGLYNWSYTEWAFIKSAEFTLMADGRLSIDVPKNESYKKIYDKGRGNYEVYINELQCLASITKLEFEPDIDLRNKIIFTRQCSNGLIAQGLHLTKKNIQNLVRMKNSLMYFLGNVDYRINDNDENKKISLRKQRSQFPREITAHIMRLAFPELNLNDTDIFDFISHANDQSEMRYQRGLTMRN